LSDILRFSYASNRILFKLPADSAPRSFKYGDLYSPWKDGLADSSNLYKELVNCLNVDVLYPGQGDNLDFLQRLKTQKDSVFNYLVREEDLYSWKFAKKGFFKFKENIPKINNFLGSGKY